MNRGVGARMHIAHVTSRQALDMVRAFQWLGEDVTGETCPQYLRFDQSALARFGAYAKVNPPLRDADDIEALWEALADGTLGSSAPTTRPSRSPRRRRPRPTCGRRRPALRASRPWWSGCSTRWPPVASRSSRPRG
jgi:hypothetical protein